MGTPASASDPLHGASGAGRDRRSVGSGAAARSRPMTASAIRFVSSPFDDMSSQPGALGPPAGIRPSDGLNPVSPQTAAGMRIEPPPSDAVAMGTSPAATAAALPP